MGKASLGFGADRFRTLVYMATESSHRVIIEKMVFPLFMSPPGQGLETHLFSPLRPSVCLSVTKSCPLYKR